MTAALRSDATALDAVAALLAPDGGPAGPTRRYAVLPSPSRPRYLVPTAGRAGAGAHLRPGTGRRAAATRWAVRGALRLGAGRLLPGAVAVADGTPGAPGLRRHLGTLVGRDEVEVAIALGGPRPNRKPVLQVLASDGRTLAWAKLGVDDHTDALVAHEADALARRPDPPVATPEVLASGTWQGHPLLVLAHMDLVETTGPLDLTVAALAAVAGPASRAPATGAWWEALRARAAAGVDPDGAVAARLDALGARLDGRTWPFGRWHGDLAPWNAAWDGDRLLVWDWERSEAPVPLGLDAVHNELQVALLRDGVALEEAVRAARRRVGPLLVGLGHDPDDVDLVVEAYLATLRVRYADDARLGPLGPGQPVAAALDAAARKDPAR
ncbi:hypothetical protein PO878_07420 [Iamia majanohamensis]|uniref:Aminoglycoside phosphotransferase domain-containing protein n=1 Tax=Iamia majanohamensis TaxID=467976 RepID=A0AAF0BSM4_9ACTN|nr:hypothetical protein [Iamia majanohamensis]WCO68556.1 hypothetical protein PO878_07420 [Iamia majanohamensis]